MPSPESLARSYSRRLIFTLVCFLPSAPARLAWLTTTLGWEAADKSESQKSADMLTRIILDPEFAIHVRTMRIFVPAEREHVQSFAFQLGAHQIGSLCDVSLTLS